MKAEYPFKNIEDSRKDINLYRTAVLVEYSRPRRGQMIIGRMFKVKYKMKNEHHHQDLGEVKCL